jgi:hypothetical protein
VIPAELSVFELWSDHMRRRLAVCLLLAGSSVLADASAAQAQQTVNFSLGYFTVLGEDARVEGDVLNSNRTFLVFDIDDFNGAAVGGEWLFPIGEYLEGGAGIGFSRRTVPTVYDDFVDPDGTEIDSDLRLRLVPVDLTFRVLPLGQRNALQPYFGAGLRVVNWRYSETGEFINFGGGGTIFRDQFVDSGSATGPVVLGGLRFGGESFTSGFEIRYHKADAELDPGVFSDDRIDLGGWTYNFTVGVRFGR